MKGRWGERAKEAEHGVTKAIEKGALLQRAGALSLPFLNLKAMVALF